MVVTEEPSFITARVRHDTTRRPSSRTVHAPHCPWSHPFLVPVSSSRSRRASSRVVQGATASVRFWPLMVSVIMISAGADFLARSFAVVVGFAVMWPPEVNPTQLQPAAPDDGNTHTLCSCFCSHCGKADCGLPPSCPQLSCI